MKTTKFKYLVFFGKSEDDELLSDEFVTLAEARIFAARYPYSCITCIGRIVYENGLEVD